jgi:hypothetical protein
MKNLTVLLLTLCVLLGPTPAASGATPEGTPNNDVIYGLTISGQLVTFAPGAPDSLLSSVNITGLSPGDVPVAIDFRPLTEDLYMLVSSGRIFRVDTDTGAATAVGSGFTTGLSGTDFGFDFNPTVDRIRVVSDNAQNLRVHPDTGAVVSVDGNLHYATGDPNQGVGPNVVGSAYANNFPGATTTTLFGIDSGEDVLVIQSPPNDGTLNTVGGLGVDTTGVVGFDIETGTGIAYAAMQLEGSFFSSLYTVDLGSGLVTLVGSINSAPLIGLAIPIGIKQGADTVGVYDMTTAAWFIW